jgi:hypothetical protein
MDRQKASTLRRTEVAESLPDLDVKFLTIHFLYHGQISLSRPYRLPLSRLRGPKGVIMRSNAEI